MGLCSDVKITTIYYYVQNTFKNDRGICNVFNLCDNYETVKNAQRCRVAYYDELELMARASGLVFDKGILCVNDGYYMWDSINKVYWKVDVNSGVI